MPVAAVTKQKKKKIKGQIPGTLYSWLVGLSVKRKCRVSKVLEEIALWACEDPDRVFPPPLVSESRNASVYRTDFAGYEDARFIKVGNHLCYIDEERSILEKATGESHPEAEWLVEVKKA